MKKWLWLLLFLGTVGFGFYYWTSRKPTAEPNKPVSPTVEKDNETISAPLKGGTPLDSTERDYQHSPPKRTESTPNQVPRTAPEAPNPNEPNPNPPNFYNPAPSYEAPDNYEPPPPPPQQPEGEYDQVPQPSEDFAPPPPPPPPPVDEEY